MEDDKELVTIAKFFHEHDAHILRAALNEEGVPAMVAGNNSTGFGMQLAGLASVEVNVRKFDVDTARKIVAKLNLGCPDIAPWLCSCGEQIDAGFEICWSCGSEHPDPSSDSASQPGDDGKS